MSKDFQMLMSSCQCGSTYVYQPIRMCHVALCHVTSIEEKGSKALFFDDFLCKIFRSRHRFQRLGQEFPLEIDKDFPVSLKLLP